MISDNVINEKYKYSDLTGKIIGVAMEVHKFLGNGFQEVIYQRALAIELREKSYHLSESKKCGLIIKERILAQEELIFLLKIKLWLK